MRNQLFFCVLSIAATLMISCSPYGQYVSSLKSSDVEVRREAAFELCKLDGIKKEYIPELLAATEDKDPLVREFALKAIGKLEPRTEGVSKVIRRCLCDPDIAVRKTTAGIFSKMNPVPAEILIPLAETMGDTDSLLYSYIKSTFIDLGPIGVNALVHSCKSKDNQLKCRAASTLGMIGQDAKRALPTLKEMLNDENDTVRTVAKNSIAMIDVSTSKVTSEVEKKAGNQ